MIVNQEEDVLLKENRVIKDKYQLVYIIVFFTGIGVLIPWNFFITVKQYFMFKLSDTNLTLPENEIQYMFENYLSVASMIPTAITNILNLFLRRYITPTRRFLVGISVMFLVFLITLIMTKISTINQQILFFTITMISVVILSVCSGIVQGSSLGIVSMMPARYIKGFMEGQAVSGLIASVANIISIAVVSSLEMSAFMYFLVALFFLLITAVGFCRLGKMKFSRSYVEISNQLDQYIDDKDSNYESDINYASDTGSMSLGTKQPFLEKYAPLIKIIRWDAATIVVTYLVTLSIYPSFISQIETLSDNKQWKKYFTPVTCFLLFNIFDYFGRFLCGYVKFPSPNYPKLLFLISLSRWIFVPLYFMSNIPKRNYFPIVFKSDIIPIIFTVLFGTTNGYIITLCLIYAPSKVAEKDKEAIGTLMSFFICFGLASGVGISFIYLLII